MRLGERCTEIDERTSADSGIRLKDGAESATPSTTLTTMPSVLALSSGCYPFCSQMDLSLQNTRIRFRIDGNNSLNLNIPTHALSSTYRSFNGSQWLLRLTKRASYE